VLADNFVRSISFDALRSLIPACDPAVRVEHEDGVVLDALNEEPEAFLGSVQSLLRAFPVRDIADDRDCKRLSAGLKRAKHNIYRELSAVLAETIQFESCTHRASVGFRRVLSAARRVALAKSFGDENLYGLADQLLWSVAKEAINLCVCLQDSPFAIDDQDRVRGELK